MRQCNNLPHCQIPTEFLRDISDSSNISLFVLHSLLMLSLSSCHQSAKGKEYNWYRPAIYYSVNIPSLFLILPAL